MSETESLVLVGINHFGAPVSSRELAAVPETELVSSLARLKETAGLHEVAVVSTCSRVEVLCAADRPEEAAGIVRKWFLDRCGACVASALYSKTGQDALSHLFRVACGLDSWIVGESEILGQVKRAYQSALAAAFTGPRLNRAFQKAMAAGKSIRTQTGIQAGVHSIGGAAAIVARRIFGEAKSGEVVVFGAGQAAEAVVRHLAAKDFGRIAVANRTLERAAELADALGGDAVAFDEGVRRLAAAEVAVFSTSCPEPLLTAKVLAPLLKGRKRPLFILDLGLPRNVEPACEKLEGAYLYDLDDLKELVRENMAEKAPAKDAAEALAAGAAAECGADMERAAARRAEPAGRQA